MRCVALRLGVDTEIAMSVGREAVLDLLHLPTHILYSRCDCGYIVSLFSLAHDTPHAHDMTP